MANATRKPTNITMARSSSIERKTRFVRTTKTKSIPKKIIKTRKKIIKTRKIFAANKTGPNLVESLPSDVIAEVVSRVASSSLADLFSCRLSCKALEQIGKEKYVIRQVDIEDFNSWRLHPSHMDAATAYFQLCADCDNPGALFRKGMREYFYDVKVEQGMKNLERAANFGHKTAVYVLGLILMCCVSGNDKNRGMELINGVKACTGTRMVDCRVRLRKTLYTIWFNNEFARQYKPIIFDKDKHDQCQRKCPWTADSYFSEDDDDDDTHFCEACMCEFESKFFCRLVSGRMVPVIF